ncbi:60S ribosomal protein L27-1 [Bienertia sinuspersici]
MMKFLKSGKENHAPRSIGQAEGCYPKKLICKDSLKKQAKKSRVKCFIKLVNYNHIMPTRYTLVIDLKDVVSAELLMFFNLEK